jgi:RNA polymerase sigma factor (TIGR02999 family)
MPGGGVQRNALGRHDRWTLGLPRDNTISAIMSDVTGILSAISECDGQAASALLPLVYDALRELAAHQLAQEAPGQTLQPTALVHEAYLRLTGGRDPSARFAGAGHFFAAAAEAMRRILIDRARSKHRRKRGGAWRRVRLDGVDRFVDESADDLLALDEALTKLAEHDAPCAELVKLRFYGGLSMQQAADALGLARRSADRCWAYARSWLYDELRRHDG